MTVYLQTVLSQDLPGIRGLEEGTERLSWSGINLKVVCADGAFPVGSVWQRSLSSACREVLYSVGDVVGRQSMKHDDRRCRRHFGLVKHGLGLGCNAERKDEKLEPGIAQRCHDADGQQNTT